MAKVNLSTICKDYQLSCIKVMDDKVSYIKVKEDTSQL